MTCCKEFSYDELMQKCIGELEPSITEAYKAINKYPKEFQAFMNLFDSSWGYPIFYSVMADYDSVFLRAITLFSELAYIWDEFDEIKHSYEAGELSEEIFSMCIRSYPRLWLVTQEHEFLHSTLRTIRANRDALGTPDTYKFKSYETYNLFHEAGKLKRATVKEITPKYLTGLWEKYGETTPDLYKNDDGKHLPQIEYLNSRAAFIREQHNKIEEDLANDKEVDVFSANEMVE